MTTDLRFYIGYDGREPVAYHVFCSSILRRASVSVAITPLVLGSLIAQGIYRRPRGPTESTEFSLTRFLVPYLSGYRGFSIFADSDMLMRTDPARLQEYIDELDQQGGAVAVCKHDYTPKDAVKMDGAGQTAYPRKNWSSFMIFNNAACTKLTPDYVNTATGLELHRFLWADENIASVPLSWNWLVDEYEDNPNADNLHFTLGGPWFKDRARGAHGLDWMEEYHRLTSPMPTHVTGGVLSGALAQESRF